MTADPAEMWFRMKFGRNTPAEEARQKALHEGDALNWSGHDCCQPAEEKRFAAENLPLTADLGAEIRYRMKYGRNTPAEEARWEAIQEYEINTADRAAEGCSEPHANSVAAEATVATADAGAEMRYRMKYGRNTPDEERRQAANSESGEWMSQPSADRSICSAECSKRAR